MTDDAKQRSMIEAALTERIEESRRYLAYSPDAPFAVGQAKASTVFDAFGSPYLDFYCADGTAIFGHNHPSIVGASAEHVRYYHNTSDVAGHHLQWMVVEYAKRLAESFGPDDLQVEFATDEHAALREAVHLATKATDRRRVLLVAGDNLWLAQDYAERSSVILPGKMLYDGDWHDYGALVLSLATLQAQPLAGVWVGDLILRANNAGVPVIINEARTGFGRTGHLWGQQHWDVHPDFTVLAGPVGGGFPLGVVVADRKWFTPPARVPALSADGVATRTGIAVLEMFDLPLLQGVAKTADELSTGLHELQAQFPELVLGHWGEGLWQAMVLPDEDYAELFVGECLGAGLVVSPPRGRVVTFSPSLIIDATDLRKGLDLMASVLMEG